MRIERRSVLNFGVAAIMSFGALTAAADETCNSPYHDRSDQGTGRFLHVWTLGEQGVGDGSDKLVTDRRRIPSSKNYGKVIHTISVGGRGEAHHMGFTDDRKYLWAGGLDDSKIYRLRRGLRPVASPSS